MELDAHIQWNSVYAPIAKVCSLPALLYVIKELKGNQLLKDDTEREEEDSKEEEALLRFRFRFRFRFHGYSLS